MAPGYDTDAGVGGGSCACISDQTAAPLMSYVGEGGGSYIQETTYKYVGSGAGHFDVQNHKNSTRIMCVAWYTGALALLVLVCCLIFMWPQSVTSTTPVPHNCDAGLANWQEGWSPGKKEWCCHHSGQGCAPPPFDCSAGIANWKTEWPETKKIWCCEHTGQGCDGSQPPPSRKGPAFDCTAGYINWRKAWSVPKKTWCCDHEGQGCVEDFDCDAGFSKWSLGWSISKKSYCCHHEGKGCAVPVN